MKNKNLNSQKGTQGVSLYIAFMIMSVLLVIAFGMSTILLGQMKMIRGMGDSVIAFYAADTGIERELLEENAIGTSYSGSLDGTSYDVSVISPGSEGCPLGVNYCIKSVGIYKETRRAVQVNR